MYKILTIVGARPQFVKSAMFSKAVAEADDMQEVIVHTGQHYDDTLSKIFFDEMGIPKPKYNLEVGSLSHAKQTAAILSDLEEVYTQEKPDITVIFGDTNSTLAGALCSAKLGIPVVHIEAGMRSYKLYQPEEINRRAADHCSELFLCSSEDSKNNLKQESITKNVFVVGDLMYDSTVLFSKLGDQKILTGIGVKPDGYVLVTCHRPESTDTKKNLQAIVDALVDLPYDVVFPMHPRTKKYLEKYGLYDVLVKADHVFLIDPVGYIDMHQLIKHAKKVATDSGGLQKEAYFHKKPCITLREFTEWVDLVDAGWNVVTGYDHKKISEAIHTFEPATPYTNIFGDGRAAHTCVRQIRDFLENRG